VIIPEPLNVDRVCVGHRGVWWSEVETKGRIAHGSMPFLGDSAIAHMARSCNGSRPSCCRGCASARRAAGRAEGSAPLDAQHQRHPRRAAEDREGYPAPVVAHSCRTMLDRRFLVEEPLEQVEGEIVALLDELQRTRKGFDYAIRDVMEFLPTFTPLDAPVVKAVADEIRRVLGEGAAFIASPGTYDQKHIARIGHLQDCIAYGPGILDLAHQPDEYVGIGRHGGECKGDGAGGIAAARCSARVEDAQRVNVACCTMRLRLFVPVRLASNPSSSFRCARPRVSVVQWPRRLGDAARTTTAHVGHGRSHSCPMPGNGIPGPPTPRARLPDHGSCNRWPDRPHRFARAIGTDRGGRRRHSRRDRMAAPPARNALGPGLDIVRDAGRSNRRVARPVRASW
jgi:hypothetical protein